MRSFLWQRALTPLQALALWNDRFVLRQAEHFAARLRAEAHDVDAQVAAGFRIALGRAPSAEEAEAATAVARTRPMRKASRARSTRPPSVGKAGIMLNSTSRTLTAASRPVSDICAASICAMSVRSKRPSDLFCAATARSPWST